MEIDCTELKKFRKLPISANPSAPIKMAMALEVKIPAIIFIKTEVEFRDATLIKTFLFI